MSFATLNRHIAMEDDFDSFFWFFLGYTVAGDHEQTRDNRVTGWDVAAYVFIALCVIASLVISLW